MTPSASCLILSGEEQGWIDHLGEIAGHPRVRLLPVIRNEADRLTGALVCSCTAGWTPAPRCTSLGAAPALARQ